MLLLIFEAKLVCQCLSCSVFENNILHFCESGSTAFGLKGQALPFPGQQSGRSPCFQVAMAGQSKAGIVAKSRTKAIAKRKAAAKGKAKARAVVTKPVKE